MKKFLLFLINLIGISFYSHALVISEVMYDPQGSDTGREWVEVYNDATSSINLSSWKFFESGTNHSLTSSQGGVVIPTHGYAVIADNPTKFLVDYPTFSGILFDSSFSLSNSGEHIAMKETSSGSEISFTDYNPILGGNDDGSTLSFISGAWTRGEATPASENKASVLESATVSATTTENQTSVTQMSPPASDVVFYLPFEKVVIAGAETEFSALAKTRSGKNIDNLICEWAFGDGGRGVGTSTKYTYAYPGKYIAQIEGSNGSVFGVGRINVRVISPDLSIEKINTGKYGVYVDIKNPNSYDLDLSQWKLLINENSFSFPKNTLIAKNSVTRFSGLAMGFASTTISASATVKILFPNLEEVAKYVYSSNSLSVFSTSTISNISLVKPPDLGVPAVAVKFNNRTTYISKKEIKIDTSTSSSDIKIVTNKTENKNTGIANWLRKLFSW